MANAARHHETLVSEFLLGASAPVTAAEILRALRTTHGMTALRKSDVNSVLYSSPAYQMVPGSQPPTWRVRQKGGDLPGPPAAAAEWHSLVGIPPLEAAPIGEFVGRPVVVGGSSGEPALVEASAAALRGRGATRFICLVGQQGGEAMHAAVAGVEGLEAVLVPYPQPVDGGTHRSVLAKAHRTALEEHPAGLCLLAPPATDDFAVHHLVICADAARVPVYRMG